MAEELKKEQDSSNVLERMKRSMESTVKGASLSPHLGCHSLFGHAGSDWMLNQVSKADL